MRRTDSTQHSAPNTFPRFLLAPGQVSKGRAYLDAAQSRHATRVLRLAAGAALIVVTADGEGYEARIESVSSGVVARLGDRLPPAPELLLVTLAQALVKGERMDWLVGKVAELGAARLIPFISDRTVVHIDKARADDRRLRWQKLADQAAQQSRAPQAMSVSVIGSLADAIRDAEGDLLLVPHEKESTQTLLGLLEEHPKARSAAVFVGPEGGFAPHEVEELRRAGGVTVSLGPRILRAETAAIVACALTLNALSETRNRG